MPWVHRIHRTPYHCAHMGLPPLYMAWGRPQNGDTLPDFGPGSLYACDDCGVLMVYHVAPDGLRSWEAVDSTPQPDKKTNAHRLAELKYRLGYWCAQKAAMLARKPDPELARKIHRQYLEMRRLLREAETAINRPKN